MWSINDTRERVGNKFGRSHVGRVASSLHAMGQRQAYARYHFYEVRRLTKQFQRKYLASQPLLFVSLGGDRVAFETYLTKAGAHALGCILSIHAIADVSAFAIYESLGFSVTHPPLMPEDKVSAGSLAKKLRQMPMYARLADLLEELIGDASFKQVVALANHSKHRGLARPSLHEDLTGESPERIELWFERLGAFPAGPAASVLKPAYAAASKAVVDIGNEINTLLSAHASGGVPKTTHAKVV